MGMGLTPYTQVKDLWQTLGQGTEIRFPVPLPGTYLSLLPIKEVPFLVGKDLVNVALPDISPARFFMDGLYKIFEGDESFIIRDESEFVGAVPENIDQEADKGLERVLYLSLGQFRPPFADPPALWCGTDSSNPAWRGQPVWSKTEKDYMIQSFIPITMFLSNRLRYIPKSVNASNNPNGRPQFAN